MRNVLQIIQGDTLQLSIALKSNGSAISSVLISKVYFTCKGLNKQYEGTYNASTSKYDFVVPATDSKDFKPNQYDYDITILFVDTKVKTALYENGLIVLAKHNGVDYE